MRLADYDERDGKKVWLEQSELDDLITEAKTPEQEIAFMLGGKCGLRRKEVAQVTPADLIETHGHYRVRVWEGKGDKYREVPCPSRLYDKADTLSYQLEPDDPIVGCHASTLWDWIQRAAERRLAATNDKGWSFLKFHDLRATWGTYLVGQGVIPGLVMQWGGWEDWETFRDNYLGEMSPEVDRREQQKVPWLADGAVDLSNPEVHSLPAGSKSFVQSKG